MKKSVKDTKVVTVSAKTKRVCEASLKACHNASGQFENAQKNILDAIEADCKSQKLHYKNADERSRRQFKKSAYSALFGLKKNRELDDVELRVYNALKKRYEKLGIVKKRSAPVRNPNPAQTVKKPEIETSKSKTLEEGYSGIMPILNGLAKDNGLTRAEVWKHFASYLVTLADN